MEGLIGSSRVGFITLLIAVLLLSGCGEEEDTVIHDKFGNIVRIEGANASGSIVMSDGRVLPIDVLFKPFSPGSEKQSNQQSDYISWNILYEDLALNTGRGFDDPSLGGARRQALIDTLEQVAIDLNIRGTRDRQLDVRIQESVFDPSASFLATGGTIYPKNHPGIFLGHALSRIQTGIDADPRLPVHDLTIQVNFTADYYLGSSTLPQSKTDFRSVIRHEVVHSLGFSSMLGPDGNSRQPSNKQIFSTYDRMLRSADGRELIDKDAKFVGTLDDLVGKTGKPRLMGKFVKQATCGKGYEVFAPATYKSGSSLSHLDDTNGGDVVMTHSISPGVTKRTFTSADNAVLRDLGFFSAGEEQRGYFYCDKSTFSVGGMVQAAVKIPFINKKDDIIILSTSIAGSDLVIYPESNSTRAYRFRLPNGTYQGMTTGPLGIDSAPAIVLSALDRESILILSNLTLPKDRTVLVKDDFEYIHQAVGPNSNSNHPYSVIDPVVAVGNLDNSYGVDVLTASNDLGLIPFLRDVRGRFDKWPSPRVVQNINSPYNPQRDLAVYRHGGPITLEIPYGLGFPGQNIFAIFEGDTPKTRSISPDLGYRISRWARKGVVALAGVERTNGNQYLMLLRQGASGDYTREHIYTSMSSISDIHLDSRSGASNGYISTAGDNRIMVLSNANKEPTVLSGSKLAGYRDGPVASALFKRPTALCQKNENLFVIDAGNSLIRAINLSTNIVTTIAGTLGVSGQVDGPGERAVLNFSTSPMVADSCTVIGDTLYFLGDFDYSGKSNQIKTLDLARNYVTGFRTEELGIEYYISNLDSVGRTLYLLSGRQGRRKIIALDKPNGSGGKNFSSLVRLGDVNGDGLDDAVTLPDPAQRLRIITVNINRGDGQMGQLTPINFDVPVNNFALADLTNDGKIDLIVMLQDHARLYRGLGDGRFEEESGWRVNYGGQYQYGRLVKYGSALPNLVIANSKGRIFNFSSNPIKGWTVEDGLALPGGISELPNQGQLEWFDMVDGRDLMLYETGKDKVMLYEARSPF